MVNLGPHPCLCGGASSSVALDLFSIHAMAVSLSLLRFSPSLISTPIPDLGGDPVLIFATDCRAAWDSVRMKSMSESSLVQARPMALRSASETVAMLPSQPVWVESSPPLGIRANHCRSSTLPTTRAVCVADAPPVIHQPSFSARPIPFVFGSLLLRRHEFDVCNVDWVYGVPIPV